MKALRTNLRDKASTILALLLAGLVSVSMMSCDKSDVEEEEEEGVDKITLTKASDAKSDWTLYLDAPANDRSGIWADVNNNRTKDNGEAITGFGVEYADRNTFPQGKSKTIGLYGKPTIFHCHDNQLAALNVSRSTALKELNCLANRLTVLDLSKNTALERLSCYNNRLTVLNFSNNPNIKYVSLYKNQISAANMTQLINSLPARKAEDDAKMYVRQTTDDNSRPTMADIAAAKAKNWKLYEFNNSTGWVEM